MKKTICVNGDDFILVEAESLSLDDYALQYKPFYEDSQQGKTKALIMEAIRNGVKNFYIPKFEPSFSADGENIRFVYGKKPATGKSYDWWECEAKKVYPKRNSRLGNRLEYGAFLGVLIKKLVDEEHMTVNRAWNLVCYDSCELGHYCNSIIAKHNCESTGFRCICDYANLENVCKILAADKESGAFWEAGGDYLCPGEFSTLGHLHLFMNKYRFNVHDGSVGWIVLS